MATARPAIGTAAVEVAVGVLDAPDVVVAAEDDTALAAEKATLGTLSEPLFAAGLLPLCAPAAAVAAVVGAAAWPIIESMLAPAKTVPGAGAVTSSATSIGACGAELLLGSDRPAAPPEESDDAVAAAGLAPSTPVAEDAGLAAAVVFPACAGAASWSASKGAVALNRILVDPLPVTAAAADELAPAGAVLMGLSRTTAAATGCVGLAAACAAVAPVLTSDPLSSARASFLTPAAAVFVGAGDA